MMGRIRLFDRVMDSTDLIGPACAMPVKHMSPGAVVLKDLTSRRLHERADRNK